MDIRNILDGNVASIVTDNKNKTWVAILLNEDGKMTEDNFIQGHGFGPNWYEIEKNETHVADLPRELFV